MVPHPNFIITHIDDDMNISIHIDINMNVDITSPHPPHAPPWLSDGRPRHGGGWSDINIHIDINMNIDIHIIINMNNSFAVGDHFQVLRVSAIINS